MKLVVTAFINDVEEKDNKLINLETETFHLKQEIKAFKEENKVGVIELKEQSSKQFKEIKVVVTSLIKDVEEKENNLIKLGKETSKLKLEMESLQKEINHDKTNCEKKDVVENCENCKNVKKSKTNQGNYEEGVHSNMSNFRFEQSKDTAPALNSGSVQNE